MKTLDKYVLTAVVTACHRLKHPSKVMSVFEDMVEMNITPDELLLDCFAEVCADGDVALAQKLLDECKKRKWKVFLSSLSLY